MLNETMGITVEPEWLSKKRSDAARLFNELPVPKWKTSEKQGVSYAVEYKYTDFSKIDLSQARASPVKSSRNPATGVIFKDFSRAITENPEEIKEYFMTKCVKPSDNKFLALHCSMANSGSIIIIPKGVNVEVPLEATYSSQGSAFTHTLIIARQDSSVSLIENHEGDGGVKSTVVEIITENGARVDYYSNRDYGKNTYGLHTMKAVLAANSEVNWLNAFFGSILSRCVVESHFAGEGSSGNNYTVLFPTGSEHIDLTTIARHDARQTHSDMLAKAALGGSATSVYRGNIAISERAQQSSTDLNENVILLSPEARSYAIPSLDVNNNDVQAGHGASVEHVDEEQLFYLESRGLEEHESKELIVQGFFEKILNKAPANLANGVRNRIAKRIGESL